MLRINGFFPSSWTYVSGQGTSSLTVIPDGTSGIVSVTPCNQCGCGSVTSLSVTPQSCGPPPVRVGSEDGKGEE